MQERRINLVTNNTSQQILITLPRSTADTWLPGGSTRSYHRGKEWDVPLNLQPTISKLEKKYHLSQSAFWPIESLDLHCIVFTVENDTDIESLLVEIRESGEVINVQKMNEFSVMANVAETNTPYNDPQFNLQYGIYANALEKLHTESRGHKVRIGIVDTQIDWAHLDLAGQLNQEYRYVPSGDTEAASVHGTAIAGIISAKANNKQGLVGLAPDAKIYSYAACYRKGTQSARCNSFNLLQAIEQAIDDDVDILNLSLSGPYDPLLEQLLLIAQQKDMIIVAASAQRAENNFPASMSGVIGVASNNFQFETLSDLATYFDQELFSDWLLRNEKLSTQSGGGYQFFYGSSVAAASVSGFAALLKSQFPERDLIPVLESFTNRRCPIFNAPLRDQITQLARADYDCGPYGSQTNNNKIEF